MGRGAGGRQEGKHETLLMSVNARGRYTHPYRVMLTDSVARFHLVAPQLGPYPVGVFAPCGCATAGQGAVTTMIGSYG